MLCALAFAFQILIIDHYSDHVNGVLMSATQFIVAGLLSIVCMFLFEKPQINDILASWWPIVYAGVFSCAPTPYRLLASAMCLQPKQA